jgi:hypothetical protein
MDGSESEARLSTLRLRHTGTRYRFAPPTISIGAPLHLEKIRLENAGIEPALCAK